MYCSYCTDQVKSSTMRERMAAARMISTLVSSPAEEAGQWADLRHISSQSIPSPHHPSPGVLVLGLARLPRHQPAGALALAAHGLLGQEAPAEVRRSHGAWQLAPGLCSPEDLHLEAVLAQAGDALVIRGAQVDHGCPASSE